MQRCPGHIVTPYPSRTARTRPRGEYRTKRVILDVYDALKPAIDTGRSYEALLNPRSAGPGVAHDGPAVMVGARRGPLSDARRSRTEARGPSQ